MLNVFCKYFLHIRCCKSMNHCIDSCDDENDKLRNLRCNTTQIFNSKVDMKQAIKSCRTNYLKLTWNAGLCIYFNIIYSPKLQGRHQPACCFWCHLTPFTEGNGADDLRDFAMLSSLASMGHWEVALQCLNFKSRPGGGKLEMFFCAVTFFFTDLDRLLKKKGFVWFCLI